MKLLDELEQAWMREHFHLWSRAQLADEFEAITGRRLTYWQLTNIGVYMDLRGAPNIGRFRKGNVSHNKGRKGWCAPGSERTWFGTGHVSDNTLPLYSERFTKGQVKIKVPGASPYRAFRKTGAHQQSHWTGKARWLWERENGTVPKGHVVITKDGDPYHLALTNLRCVPRAVLARLNQRHFVKPAGREIEPVRRAVAELDVRARQRSAQ